MRVTADVPGDRGAVGRQRGDPSAANDGGPAAGWSSPAAPFGAMASMATRGRARPCRPRWARAGSARPATAHAPPRGGAPDALPPRDQPPVGAASSPALGRARGASALPTATTAPSGPPCLAAQTVSGDGARVVVRRGEEERGQPVQRGAGGRARRRGPRDVQGPGMQPQVLAAVAQQAEPLGGRRPDEIDVMVAHHDVESHARRRQRRRPRTPQGGRRRCRPAASAPGPVSPHTSKVSPRRTSVAPEEWVSPRLLRGTA